MRREKLKSISPERSKLNSDDDAVLDGKLKHSWMLSENLKRWWVLELMQPLEKLLVSRGVRPNTVTSIGAFLNTLACLCIALNFLGLGGWLLFLAGSFDFLDGRVARITGLQSRAGGFFDAVMDRYMDASIFLALVVLFRDTWVIYIVFLAFFGSVTTSYIRARAEALGLECKGGSMQRPERILYIGLGCLFSSYFSAARLAFEFKGFEAFPWILVFSVCFVAIAANIVAVQRFRESFLKLQ